MKKVTRSAVLAAMATSVSAPSCRVKTTDGFQRRFIRGKSFPLTALSPYFSDGMISALVNYAVLSKNDLLDEVDVGLSYCSDLHIQILRADEQTVLQGKMQDDPGLSTFLERGFRLFKKDLPIYLYSCIGTPGRILEKNGEIANVATDEAYLRGVYAPTNHAGDWVIVHFASIVCTVTKPQVEAIRRAQSQNDWYRKLCSKIARIHNIDYRHFCRGDATKYAIDHLRFLTK